jgi:hypothetical protein
MPIASESVIIELAFFLKVIQLLLLVFFTVENSIVIFRKIIIYPHETKKFDANRPTLSAN